MTELGHILYWLFLLRSLRRNYNWLITTIWQFLTFKTLPPHFLNFFIILFFQVDPGPCRYYPAFFPVMWRYYTQKFRHLLSSWIRIRIAYPDKDADPGPSGSGTNPNPDPQHFLYDNNFRARKAQPKCLAHLRSTESIQCVNLTYHLPYNIVIERTSTWSL